jgi:hypothetical protein
LSSLVHLIQKAYLRRISSKQSIKRFAQISSRFCECSTSKKKSVTETPATVGFNTIEALTLSQLRHRHNIPSNRLGYTPSPLPPPSSSPQIDTSSSLQYLVACVIVIKPPTIAPVLGCAMQSLLWASSLYLLGIDEQFDGGSRTLHQLYRR